MGLPLSVVVVAYGIPRELPRTLLSLSGAYQRGIAVADFEIIVVDNGSPTPIDESVFEGLDGQFRLIRIDDADASPAAAANRGIAEAQGDIVGVMIDGARIVTPGLLHQVIVGSGLHPRTGVVTLGWYLGEDFQRHQLEAGWTSRDEDALLESIDWPNDGYRLFEIATMDESSVDGWFFGAFESNGIFFPKSVWEQLQGFDPVFDAPGGGMMNHDLFRRAVDLDDVSWVVLLGEATFHQLHGGVATNIDPVAMQQALIGWQDQYQAVRGRGLAESVGMRDPVLLGTLPAPLQLRFGFAVNTMLHAPVGRSTPLPPQVELPDPASASNVMASHWFAAAVDAMGEQRNTEAQAFAREARSMAPDFAGPRDLLQYIAHGAEISDLPKARQAKYFVDAGDACHRAGEREQAEAHYQAALAIEPGKLAAYEGLSRLRMPGRHYQEWLGPIHDALNPATYLEIGVFEGESLAHARPPTVAVGVDPDPKIREPISVEFHLYRETSSEFFTRDVRTILGGAGPSLVFIDGLHEFPAVLEDFARVEQISDPDTVVLLHDMIPFDEVTSRAEREHEFYTGDVWKLLHCFADVRPDLSWFTIRTPPSGLTIVSGLDPSSTVLLDQYDKLLERHGRLSFTDALDVPGPVIANDPAAVQERLGVLARAATAPRVHPGVGDPKSTERLSRRVRQLETSDATLREELTALKRASRRTGSLAVPIDEASALAELERLRATKVFRYSRAIRNAYSRLRFRRRVE